MSTDFQVSVSQTAPEQLILTAHRIASGRDRVYPDKVGVIFAACPGQLDVCVCLAAQQVLVLALDSRRLHAHAYCRQRELRHPESGSLTD